MFQESTIEQKENIAKRGEARGDKREHAALTKIVATSAPGAALLFAPSG
jgi:hypothetical protein